MRDSKGNYHPLLLRCSVTLRLPTGEAAELTGAVIDVSEMTTMKKKIRNQGRQLRELSFRNSHDLRAPVATALGLIHLIQNAKQEDNDKQQMVNYLEKTILSMDKAIHEFDRNINMLL